MIDTDEYIEAWDDNLLTSEGVQTLLNTLIAEVKRLREYQDKLHYALDLCASKQIERWIDKEEARIWGLGGEEE